MSTKDDVFNYVMNSPEDTNPAVLRSLLNGIEEGGSGGGDMVYTIHAETYYDQSSGLTGFNILPDESGNYLTRPKIVELFESGARFELNVNENTSYKQLHIPLLNFNDRGSGGDLYFGSIYIGSEDYMTVYIMGFYDASEPLEGGMCYDYKLTQYP